MDVIRTGGKVALAERIPVIWTQIFFKPGMSISESCISLIAAVESCPRNSEKWAYSKHSDKNLENNCYNLNSIISDSIQPIASSNQKLKHVGTSQNRWQLCQNTPGLVCPSSRSSLSDPSPKEITPKNFLSRSVRTDPVHFAIDELPYDDVLNKLVNFGVVIVFGINWFSYSPSPWRNLWHKWSAVIIMTFGEKFFYNIAQVSRLFKWSAQPDTNDSNIMKLGGNRSPYHMRCYHVNVVNFDESRAKLNWAEFKTRLKIDVLRNSRSLLANTVLFTTLGIECTRIR